jgi:hypothetical protein
MWFIGIDPGKTGAIAIVNEYRQGVVVSMPPDERTIRDLFCNVVKEYYGEERPSKKCMVALEWEHSFPGCGAASSWTFGVHYGFIRGVLTALDVPFEEIGPQQWMRALRIKKNIQARSKANQLARTRLWYPHFKPGRENSDAILIAEFMRRTWTHDPYTPEAQSEEEAQPL